MSVNLYDKAFVEKLRNWTKNTQVSIVGPGEYSRLIEVMADSNNDSPLKLPFISLTRPGGYEILTPTKQPLSYDGLTLEANHEQACQLNAIPISIPYQLDVYTRYFEEADEFTRNLVFNIINYPKLTITIPYNDRNYKHDASIRLSGDVEDNSDIPERLVSGQFSRMSMHIDVDNAYLFDVRYRDVYSICFRTEVSDKTMEEFSKDVKLEY